MRELRRHGRRGFSFIELLIVVAIILILAAIAAPKLNQNRMHAQETAAIRQIGTIHTAQTQYYSQFGRYAATLAELGPPPSGQASAAAADLIPEDLAKGKKTGLPSTFRADPTDIRSPRFPTYSETRGGERFSLIRLW